MDMSKKLKYGLEYGVLRSVVFILKILPIDTSAGISAFVWRNLASRTRRHKRGLDNLSRAFPNLTSDEKEKILLDMWDNLGRVMAESLQIERLLKENHRFSPKPGLTENIFKRYHGKRGAAVNVSMHTGNWEVSVWPMIKMETPTAAVYRKIKNPYVDAYIRKVRGPLYPKGLVAKKSNDSKDDGMDVARKLTKIVRDGGKLGMLGDLYDKFGIDIDFFGHPARSTPFPAMLARRSGSRLWVARCIRLGKQSRFELEIKEIHVPHSANRAEDIRIATQSLHSQFEEWIREYPEQWMWSNRRWS